MRAAGLKPGPERRAVIAYGRGRRYRFFKLTTNPTTLSPETTQCMMTNVAGNVWTTLGDTYGLRTWIAYGFRQAKQALGRAGYRLINYTAIER